MAIRTADLIPPAATPDMIRHELRVATQEGRAPRQLVTRAVQVERARIHQPAVALSQASAGLPTIANMSDAPSGLVMPLFDPSEQAAAEAGRLQEYLEERDGEPASAPARLGVHLAWGFALAAVGVGTAYLVFGR